MIPLLMSFESISATATARTERDAWPASLQPAWQYLQRTSGEVAAQNYKRSGLTSSG
jgi:hypothetical protein